MKIALVSIPVHNPLEAFKFYTETLGFIKKQYIPEQYIAIVASPEEPDGTSLLLEPNAHPVSKAFQEGVYNLGLPLIIFGVDDVQKEYERLKSLGVVFKQPPAKTEWGIQAILEDTCGNYVQIHQVV
jgi:predicted enzyme related to lactoylglutathione lyase